MAAKTAVMADVAQRLRGLRESRGIPKERVALALRMSAGNWAHYESGRNQLAVSQLPTLAELFDITVADLVVALFDLRDICNNPGISDNGRDESVIANYNYTDDAKWLSGLGSGRWADLRTAVSA